MAEKEYIERGALIKALECCKKDDCDNCSNDFGNCYANLAGYALELINRYEAEIANLGIELKAMRGAANSYKAEVERLTVNMNAFGLGMKREAERADTARAEAIKEFAERVKDIIDEPLQIEGRIIDRMLDKIDNLVKEMTEGQK